MRTHGEHVLTFRDYVLTFLQYTYPQHFLSSMMFRITQCKWVGFKNRLIRWFIDRYHVDMASAQKTEPEDYEDFNTFFTRELRADIRGMPLADDELMSPADGVVSQLGKITDGRIVQAKNRWYTVQELFFGDEACATQFENGSFATIYLSPRDYHRVHMPYDGELRKMSYVPGRLFSVNPTTTCLVPRLFARNERVIAQFDTLIGPMALVMVGAIFVGSIQTVWHGLVTPPHGQKYQTWTYLHGNKLSRGDEMGRFNMGSTVILLLSRDAATWRDDLGPGSRVLMGEVCAGRLSRQGSNTQSH